MKNILFISFLLLIFLVSAGNIIAVVPCTNNSFTDSDKRDFGDKTVLHIDVDGDGKSDTITPRTYKTKPTKPTKGISELHWITFDLKTSQGKTINSFFTFKYGDNRADYWVYALVLCNIKGGKENDLLFYTGDDTSDKTVILENKGTSFRVYSRKEKVY